MELCSLANVTRNSLSAINRLVAKQNPSRILEWFGLQDTDLYIYISLFIAYTAIDTLASHERQTLNTKLESIRIAKNESIVDNKSDTKINAKPESKQSLNDQIQDIWVLTKRAQLVSIRNPHVIWLRFLFMIISLFTKLMMYSGVKVGQWGGGECADRESVLARLSEFGSRESTERFRALQQNCSYILSNILFIHAVNIGPTLMTFTVELNIFVKEHFNKWYTCWSYFTARSLVDIPIVLILTIMFSTIMWWITGQVWDGWRFSAHLLIMILLALVSHSLGLLVSAIFMNNIRVCLWSFTIFIAPQMLLSGALIPIRVLPSYLQTF
ncbi:unnamed protein product, partial [Oppiella nova]